MSPDELSTTTSSSRLRRFLTLLAIVLGVAWASTCIVFVDETEVVLIERLGQIVAVYDRDDDRGLAVKFPWPLGTVRRFDRRVQLFNPPGREMFTRDKKNVTVDAYVCWRIAHPVAESEPLARPAVNFFRSLGSISVAQGLLETRVRSALTSRIAQVEMGDLMSVSDPESPPLDNQRITLSSLSTELLAELQGVSENGQSLRETLGVELVDVRIKRVNFPLGNQQAVFERMRSERQKIADRYRSAGLAESTVIRSRADRQHAEIMAKADADAERIRGEAEAESLRIINTAQARDPEFYRTLKMLDGYKKLLNDRTTLVVSASSDLFKLLFDGPPPPPKGVPGEKANAASPAPQ